MDELEGQLAYPPLLVSFDEGSLEGCEDVAVGFGVDDDSEEVVDDVPDAAVSPGIGTGSNGRGPGPIYIGSTRLCLVNKLRRRKTGLLRNVQVPPSEGGISLGRSEQ